MTIRIGNAIILHLLTAEVQASLFTRRRLEQFIKSRMPHTLVTFEKQYVTLFTFEFTLQIKVTL